MITGCKLSNGHQRFCYECSPLSQKKCQQHSDDNARIVAARIARRGDFPKDHLAREDNAAILLKKRLAREAQLPKPESED